MAVGTDLAGCGTTLEGCLGTTFSRPSAGKFAALAVARHAPPRPSHPNTSAAHRLRHANPATAARPRPRARRLRRRREGPALASCRRPQPRGRRRSRSPRGCRGCARCQHITVSLNIATAAGSRTARAPAPPRPPASTRAPPGRRHRPRRLLRDGGSQSGAREAARPAFDYRPRALALFGILSSGCATAPSAAATRCATWSRDPTALSAMARFRFLMLQATPSAPTRRATPGPFPPPTSGITRTRRRRAPASACFSRPHSASGRCARRRQSVDRHHRHRHALQRVGAGVAAAPRVGGGGRAAQAVRRLRVVVRVDCGTGTTTASRALTTARIEACRRGASTPPAATSARCRAGNMSALTRRAGLFPLGGGPMILYSRAVEAWTSSRGLRATATRSSPSPGGCKKNNVRQRPARRRFVGQLAVLRGERPPFAAGARAAPRRRHPTAARAVRAAAAV